MKKLVLAILVLVVLMLAACSSITVPVAITDNPVGSKTGESTATQIGPILLSGDVSYSTAAANGGVTKIATVERRIETTLFVHKITTIVTGN
jgi:nitrous oxide reductase accessory protein NosL